MSLLDKLLFRKRAIIETLNGEFKNIKQVEHFKHRTFDNFIVNPTEGVWHIAVFDEDGCESDRYIFNIQKIAR